MGNLLLEKRLATATCLEPCSLLQVTGTQVLQAVEDPHAMRTVAKKVGSVMHSLACKSPLYGVRDEWEVAASDQTGSRGSWVQVPSNLSCASRFGDTCMYLARSILRGPYTSDRRRLLVSIAFVQH